jgi:hypothetical protein
LSPIKKVLAMFGAIHLHGIKDSGIVGSRLHTISGQTTDPGHARLGKSRPNGEQIMAKQSLNSPAMTVNESRLI